MKWAEYLTVLVCEDKFGGYLTTSIPYICLCEDAVSKKVTQRTCTLALKTIDTI